jgi:acylphosphatase
MSADERVRAHVWISGRVQMVYFRGTAQQVAAARGLTGWVRNLPDLRVEAVFEGPRADVQALIDWCHEGSPSARVDAVDVRWEPPQDEPPAFRVR